MKIINQIYLSSIILGCHAKPLHPKNRFLTIRGGDLGPIKKDVLAQAFTTLPALDAIGGIFLPKYSASKAGITIEKGSLTELLTIGAGAHATGVALTNYLATTGKMSVEQAIVYGVIARVVIMIQSFATHGSVFKKINILPLLTLATILSLCSYSLFTGAFDTKIAGIVLSKVLGIAGLVVYLAPDFFLQNLFNESLESQGANAELITKVVGLYLFLGSFQTGLYVLGVDPVKTVSCLSFFLLPTVLSLPDIFKVKRIFGISTKVFSFVFFCILNLFAVGTLI